MKSSLPLLLLLFFLHVPPSTVHALFAADYPSWWSARGVANTNASVTNDYAALTQGQLKWMAAQAAAELDANLAGGAGTNVQALVASFTFRNNYAAVNLGQLKATARPFYDRLIEAGLATNYPWTGTVADDNDYALANIGQMKFLFSFDVTGRGDADGDGLPDWWELQIVNADPADRIETIEHVLPDDDFDRDGVSNRDEALLGTDPTDPASVPCLARFALSVAWAAEPAGSNAAVSVAIRLTQPLAAEAQVRVAITGGTARRGDDYDFADQTVAFSPGQTNREVTVTLKPDELREPEETIVLGLSVLAGQALAPRGEAHVIRIADGGADSDLDGLPDWWELRYFGNLGQAATDDPDSDDLDNLAEYLRGMNPTTGARADPGNTLELQVETPMRK